MDKRPPLDKEISLKDFKEFYWLKEELVQFCRTENLKRGGSKIELARRIENYLLTGAPDSSPSRITKKVESNFDWHKALITEKTVITDNYRNTENVRSFFRDKLGKQFKFNVRFMDWMKSNIGKTMADAIIQWRIIKIESKTKINKKHIAPQFEYNRYIRDFLADNPDSSRNEAIKLWNIKRRMRGDNHYSKQDLKLLK